SGVDRAQLGCVANDGGYAGVGKAEGFLPTDPKVLLQPNQHEAMFVVGRSLSFEHTMDGLRTAYLGRNREVSIDEQLISCSVVTATYVPAKPEWTGAAHSTAVCKPPRCCA